MHSVVLRLLFSFVQFSVSDEFISDQPSTQSKPPPKKNTQLTTPHFSFFGGFLASNKFFFQGEGASLFVPHVLCVPCHTVVAIHFSFSFSFFSFFFFFLFCRMILGSLFAFVSAGFHIFFFYLESVAYPNKPSVQRMFLGKKAESKELVEVCRTLLFNQGFYNLFLAIGTIYGLLSGERGLVRFTLLCYIFAGVVLYYSNPSKYRGTLLQSVPALLAFLTY